MYGLVHTATKVYHLASQSDPLNPDPTHPTLVVAFQMGTSKSAQLTNVASFMTRSRDRKEIGMSVQKLSGCRMLTWLCTDMGVVTERRFHLILMR